MGLSNNNVFEIDPASLRFRLRLIRSVFDADQPWTGETGTQEIAEVWAGLLDIASRRQSEAEQQKSSTTYRFVCRYREDVSNAEAVVFDDQQLEFLSVHDPDQRKSWLIVEARSVLGNDQ